MPALKKGKSKTEMGDIVDVRSAADAGKLKDLNTGAQTEFTFSEWARNCDANNWIKEIDAQFFSDSVGKASK
jgi:hypothetical protein